MVCLRVGHNQVKVCHFTKLFRSDDGSFKVSDTYVKPIAGDGLIVQIVFELESYRHFENLVGAAPTPHLVSILKPNNVKRVVKKDRSV